MMNEHDETRPADPPSGRTDIPIEEDFPHYSEAYRYGHWLGSQEENRNRTWQDIEAEARRQWEERYDRPWDEFKEIIRHSWNDTMNQFVKRLTDSTQEHLPPDSYEARFRRHFDRTYARRGRTYREAAPAYHFGYDLAVDQRNAGRDWEELEPEAVRRWEEHHVNLFWEEAVDGARYAFEEVRNSPQGHPDHVSDYEGYSAEFRQHFEATFAQSGEPYVRYVPAYHHGYDLAVSPQFREQAWSQVQMEARRRWEKKHAEPWEQVEAAVRFAWNAIRAHLSRTTES
jgi:hypothetical protein